jgi:hypothetical protein
MSGRPDRPPAHTKNGPGRSHERGAGGCETGDTRVLHCACSGSQVTFTCCTIYLTRFSGVQVAREMFNFPKSTPRSTPRPFPASTSETSPLVSACASADLTTPACTSP